MGHDLARVSPTTPFPLAVAASSHLPWSSRRCRRPPSFLLLSSHPLLRCPISVAGPLLSATPLTRHPRSARLRRLGFFLPPPVDDSNHEHHHHHRDEFQRLLSEELAEEADLELDSIIHDHYHHRDFQPETTPLGDDCTITQYEDMFA